MVLKVRQTHFIKTKVCKVKYFNQKAKHTFESFFCSLLPH